MACLTPLPNKNLERLIEALSYLSLAFLPGFGWRCLSFATKSPQQNKHHPPTDTLFIRFHFIPFPDIAIPELGRPGQASMPSDSTSVLRSDGWDDPNFPARVSSSRVVAASFSFSDPWKHCNADEVSERELLVISLS